MQDSPLAWLTVLRAPLLGAAGLRRAIASTGSIQALLACSTRQMVALGLAPEAAAALNDRTIPSSSMTIMASGTVSRID